jgi:hypothetical protein
MSLQEIGEDWEPTRKRERVFEIEEVGIELETDEDAYAGYELRAADSMFSDEAPTPTWVAGSSIADALSAACERRFARGTLAPAHATTKRHARQATLLVGLRPPRMSGVLRAVAASSSEVAVVHVARAARPVPELAQAVELLEALVEFDPSPDRLRSLARALVQAGRIDDARAVLDLAVALRVPLSPEHEELARTSPRLAHDEAYAGHLDDQLHSETLEDGDGTVARVLDALGDEIALLAAVPARALFEAGFDPAARLTADAEPAVVTMWPKIAKALVAPPALLFSSRKLGDQVRIVRASSPVVVFGHDITAIHGEDVDPMIDPVLRFICGRAAELCRPRRMLATAGSPQQFQMLLDAVWHAFGPRPGRSIAASRALAAKLRARLSGQMQDRIGELIVNVPRETIDAHRYSAACRRAADRSGLLACGDASVALELCPSRGELIKFAASRRYRRARRALVGHE